MTVMYGCKECLIEEKGEDFDGMVECAECKEQVVAENGVWHCDCNELTCETYYCLNCQPY